jgi:transposase
MEAYEMSNRRNFSKEFKSKVAIEALKGQQTANEIAQEFRIHVSQVNEWKKQLLEGASGIFRHIREEDNTEQERERLYQQIGKLQVELEWLKKKTVLPAGRSRKSVQ